MPLCRRHWRVTVCGRVWRWLDRDEPDVVREAKRAGVQRIDFAEDLDGLYARTRISVCPMQGGTGMKIKTVESMARGIPVVATVNGVDGFADKSENGCLVADSPAEFAAGMDRLLEVSAFYESRKRRMVEYFNRHFSRSVVGPVLDELFELDGEVV